MKGNILRVTLILVITVAAFTVYAQADPKTGEAGKDVAKGAFALRHAKLDSATDFQKFTKEAELTISENRAKIAGLKKMHSSQPKAARATYDDKVLTLEKRNNDMTMRVHAADLTQTNNWTSFKNDFSHDMNELVTSINEMDHGGGH